MKFYVCVFVLLPAWASMASATDYCSASHCQSGQKHVGCGNDNTMSPNCPSAVEIFDLNEHNETIVDTHNFMRNFIASGSDERFLSARHMATIRWCPELAKLAEMFLKTCNYNTDYCHNTDEYKFSGKNFVGSYSVNRTQIGLPLVLEHIKGWFDERADADMSYIKSYREPPQYSLLEQFTLMVNDRNVGVGCAAITTVFYKNFSFITVCLYATTNWIGLPVYVSGPAGLDCQTGPNPKYPSLCSVDEIYDVNRSFS